MKNFAKVLTLILAVTFLATGCNLLNKDESVATPQEVNADNVLDQQIYQRAISMQDSKACETIVNESVKEECENVANALVLTDQAVNDLDKKICGKIKLSRYEKECEDRVGAILENQKAGEKAQEEYERRQAKNLAIEQKAVDTKDYTICNQIQDATAKGTCQYNVLANLAISQNDPSECDKIDDSSMRNACKESL